MELLLLPLLILINGVFALSEIAVLSAREARLRALADQGRPGAGSALGLKRNPTVFLSTIQIGITMVGILSGAIGETALVEPLGRWLSTVPVLAPHADLLALAVVVIGLTWVSVVVGELVPKQLGLAGAGRHPGRPADALPGPHRPAAGLAVEHLVRPDPAAHRRASPARDRYLRRGDPPAHGPGRGGRRVPPQ